MSSRIEEIESCRGCDNQNLTEILSLGELHVSDFIAPDEPDTLKAPLDLVLCNASDGGCGLLQLRHSVDQDYLYREYWYKSGINESMVESLNDVATKGADVADLSAGDLVLDIGCNDGTLLRQFETDGLVLAGFDPAENIVDEARDVATEVINDYFDATAFKQQFGDQKANLITSIAMFYDLRDPNGFVEDIVDCLEDEGVWVIQMGYLLRKLEQNAFDWICHEHLEYYSLLPLENLLSRHGLEVFDLEINDVNGGSIRVYVRKEGSAVSGFDGADTRLESCRESEQELGLNDSRVYEEFARQVRNLKAETCEFIEQEVEDGKTVYVYGASTKGNTLLQYYGLDNTLIEGAAERNPDKYGKRTVGTHIPIVPEAEAREKADYFLALPWHFMDVFVRREAEFLKEGGKFIKPLPELEILDKESIPVTAC